MTIIKEMCKTKITIILILFLLFFVSFPFAQDRRTEIKESYEKGKEYYEQYKYKEAQECLQKALSLISREEKASAGKADKLSEKEESLTVEYVIGVEDILYVSVWQNKDLDQELIVRPDGKISFPLIGDVQAAGLTVTQLDELMTGELKDYIKYPDVSISVKKLAGKKVIVLGNVINPGVYNVTGRGVLLEAIALAGGFNPDAVISSIIVIRGGFQNPKGIRVNLSRTLNKADISQNILLQSEDIIYIPNKFIENIDYFMNQIK